MPVQTHGPDRGADTRPVRSRCSTRSRAGDVHAGRSRPADRAGPADGLPARRRVRAARAARPRRRRPVPPRRPAGRLGRAGRARSGLARRPGRCSTGSSRDGRERAALRAGGRHARVRRDPRARSGLRDTVPLGAVMPLTRGSGGKVLLAWAIRPRPVRRRAARCSSRSGAAATPRASGSGRRASRASARRFAAPDGTRRRRDQRQRSGRAHWVRDRGAPLRVRRVVAAAGDLARGVTSE